MHGSVIHCPQRVNFKVWPITPIVTDHIIVTCIVSEWRVLEAPVAWTEGLLCRRCVRVTADVDYIPATYRVWLGMCETRVEYETIDCFHQHRKYYSFVECTKMLR